MSGVNKVIILGNLGQVPTVRYMPNGEAVTNLSVATSETWKDKQTDQPREKTEWHRVVMFGRLAETASKHLVKGSKVYIEGALQTRKWQNQQGQTQYTTEIVVQAFNGSMQMLDSPPNQNGGQQTGSYSRQGQQQYNNASLPNQQQSYFQQQKAQPYNGPDRTSRLNQPKVAPQEPMVYFDDGIPV